MAWFMWLLSIFLFSNFALANCENIDLRAKFETPVRHQDGVGWCYAYAAADLIQYRTGKNVSAADLAIQVFRKNPYKFIMANDHFRKKNLAEASYNHSAQDALSTASLRGVCEEKEFPSADVVFAKNNGKEQSAKLLDLLEAYDNLFALKNKKTPILAEEFCELAKVPMAFQLNFSVEETWLALKKEYNPFQFMIRSLAAACEKKRTKLLGEAKAVIFSPANKNDYHSKLQELLKKKNPPIITYSSGFLVDPSTLKKPSYDHTSLLVGMRKAKDGSCEYLIRNSWGRSCAAYQNAKAYLQCEDGYIWAKAETLVTQMNQLTHFP